MKAEGSRRLLTFRLDTERRQRLRARLAREGRTMSDVVTNGLRQYVQHARHRDQREGGGGAAALVLPERVAARLRELRSSGRSELLSATLAALHDAGWPLRPLAEALGISKQAVQARVRRRRAAAGHREPVPVSEPPVTSEPVAACEPPPFPQRRVASTAGLRPHLTVKIDYTLRATAHRVAADEGHSLTQVVEGILDRYLADGDASGAQAPREASRAASRSR
jgi:antitoxin component of RelBE/YafQ-DinJ toxin-antitoxin module